MFGIKDGYQDQPVCYFPDTDETHPRIYQPDVYAMAELLAELTGRHHIIDVGCGKAGKLTAMAQRHPTWDYMGIDHGPNIEWCQANLGYGKFFAIDFDGSAPRLTLAHLGFRSVVICSDVIEHLADPSGILHALAASGAICVISTPERDLQWGVEHMGPSPNICHVREWNLEEFVRLLGEHGLNVAWSGLTRSADDSYEYKTILAICRQ